MKISNWMFYTKAEEAARNKDLCMQEGTHDEKPGKDPTRYVLAIDLGSGGHKAAIVSDSGKVIASAEENIVTHMLPDGGAEQDPGEWWDGAVKTAKKVIRESGVSPEGSTRCKI